MMQPKWTRRGAAVLAALPLGVLLLAAGCSKPQTATPGGAPPGRGMRGRGRPVAANATGPEIYQQKCVRCHGDQGQGQRGPSLKNAASRPEAEIAGIVRSGRGRMPAYQGRLTEPQITRVAAFVKTLTPPK